MPIGQYVISLSEDPISWKQARAVAKSLGGDLASLSGAAERTQILEALDQSDAFWSGVSNDKIGPWIGLTKISDLMGPNNEWHWLDGSAFDVNFWQGTQPDNDSGQDNYGAIYLNTVWPITKGVYEGWGDFAENPPALNYPAIYSFITEVSATTAGISGTSGYDHIIAGDSANEINGMAGADRMEGRGGDDTYFVDNLDDAVFEETDAGNDTVITTTTYALLDFQEIEQLKTNSDQSKSNINLFGNNINNKITGNSGDNILSGEKGADIMIGLSGNDTYGVDNVGDKIIERPGDGIDTIISSINLSLGANCENLTLIGIEKLDGSGNGLSNTIIGNSGDNVLDGKGGADRLAGNDGNDVYFIDNTRDAIIENADQGYDTVFTFVSYNLSNNVEKATLLGKAEINVSGNNLANYLIGNSSANILDGKAGIDTMEGGAGDDTYFIDNSADIVLERTDRGYDTVVAKASYRLAAGQEIETLQASDIKSKAALKLYGNEFDNKIAGNSGANFIDGGKGSDELIGGAGNDIYIVDSLKDRVVETARGGTDTVVTTISYTLGAGQEIERLKAASSKGNLVLTGNEFANSLVGNGGNNVLDGKGGADVMEGGAGNDAYFVDHASDRVIESVSAGRDTVFTTVSYKLAAGQQIETLQIADTSSKIALKLTGNEFSNKLLGNAGANVLDGGVGIDEMRGGAGHDTYIVDNARDLVIEALRGGTDTVLASVSYALAAAQEIESVRLSSKAGSASLSGNELGQSLVGNDGANVLNGGFGNDVLTGGRSADTFVFATKLGSGNVDHITDFTGADTIRLDDAIFRALAPGQLKASEFKDIAGAKVDADDHILYDSRDGSLFYDADGSGKAAAVKFAVIDNKAAITHADFLIA